MGYEQVSLPSMITTGTRPSPPWGLIFTHIFCCTPGVVSGDGFSQASAVPTGGKQNGALAAAAENQGLKAQVQNRALPGTAEAVPCYRAGRKLLRNQGL